MLLTVKDVRDWLAGLFTADTVLAGFLDANLTQCLSVYQRDTGDWNQAIGGSSTYQRFHAKVLVHWGTTSNACEVKATAVFNAILANRSHYAGINMDRPPVLLGRDSKGIFEAVVIFTIIYGTE